MYKIFCFLFFWGITNNGFSKEKIFLAFNKKGTLGVTSQIVIKGIDIAIKINPKLKEKYELIHIDTDDTLELTLKTLNQAYRKHKPIAIIGAVSSNEALLINAFSLTHKIPFITPLATHPKVTSSNPFAVRTCFDDDFQAKALSEFIAKKETKKKGVILVNVKQAYASGFSEIFTNNFMKSNQNSIKSFSFSSLDEIKKKHLVEILKSKPEFVLIPSYQTEAASIISLLSEYMKEVTFYGPDSWGGGRLFHSILGSLPYKINGFYVQHWSPEANKKENQPFLKAAKDDEFLKKHFSIAMLAPAAAGYDAFNFLDLANSNKVNATTEALMNSLRSVSYKGLSGEINLMGEQTPHKNLFIYKVTNQNEKFYQKY